MDTVGQVLIARIYYLLSFLSLHQQIHIRNHIFALTVFISALFDCSYQDTDRKVSWSATQAKFGVGALQLTFLSI